MPNKYEREIEEILRNMERSEPKASLGQKFGGRLRRKSDQRMNARKRSSLSFTFTFNFSTSTWLLIIAWVAALIAGGYAYAQGEPSLITGILAIVATISLIVIVLLPFLSRRYPAQSSRYGNVTPLRRNPLGSLATRWNLFLLKLRYRRKRDH